jgi:hypothetical protein
MSNGMHNTMVGLKFPQNSQMLFHFLENNLVAHTFGAPLIDQQFTLSGLTHLCNSGEKKSV